MPPSRVRRHRSRPGGEFVTILREANGAPTERDIVFVDQDVRGILPFSIEFSGGDGGITRYIHFSAPTEAMFEVGVSPGRSGKKSKQWTLKATPGPNGSGGGSVNEGRIAQRTLCRDVYI